MEVIVMFLPGLIALIAAVTIWSRPNLTLSLRNLGWLMLVGFLWNTFTAMTNIRHVDPDLMVWSFIGLGFTSPTLQYTVLILCWTLTTQQQRYNKYVLLLLLIPAFTGVIVMSGYGLIGFSAAADYYAHGNMMPAGLSNYEKAEYDVFRFLTSDFYLFSSGLGILVTVVYQIYLLYKTDFTPMVVLRFLFQNGPIRPLHILIFLYFGVILCSVFRMRVDRQYALNHTNFYTFLYAIQSVLFAMVGLLGLVFKSPCFYLRRPHPRPLFVDMPVQVHNPFKPTTNPNELEDEEAESYRTLNLRDELKVLMREEACYLQPGMSRYSVSSRLYLSRAGLDRLILLLHHCTYNDYVMVQKVEYYRRYKALYPSEPHESVAMACGFPNVRTMKSTVNECRSFFKPLDSDNEL